MNSIKSSVIAAVVAVLLIALYLYNFRPARVWVDGEHFLVSGPARYDVTVIRHREGDKQSVSKSTVAVLAYSKNGSVSADKVSRPDEEGARFELKTNKPNRFEAVDDLGVTWIYEVSFH